ncbi:MAG: Crp/Fnr family transcriptional regulator [Hyphomonadaceae bacterium]
MISSSDMIIGAKQMHGRETNTVHAAWAKFCGLAPNHPGIAALADESIPLQLRDRATLINQGDKPDTVFLVLTGELKVVKYSENGHEVWLASISRGDLVGEIGSLIGTERTSTIVATSDCQMLALSSHQFEVIAARFSEVSRAIMGLLARRLQGTTEQLSELVAMPVAARLHAELIRVAQVSALDSELLEIPPEVTVSALGERIHATREATSRAMSALEKRGLVSRRSHPWTVLLPQI